MPTARGEPSKSSDYTDAVTRVLIEFGDRNGDTWSTVGVSGNIIEASFQALVDAINYRLLKVGVAAQ
jgi:2-isopropylmalate synthase